MKLKQSRLQQIIKEELERIGEDTPRSFDTSDESDKGFDASLDEMREIMQEVAFDVIYHYQTDAEKYGTLTKNDARSQVIEVLQATVDNFVEDSFPAASPGLETILDEEFGDDEGELEPPEEESSEEIHF